MCLRFVFLLITRVAAGLRLSRREEMWKTAEILILRHQLSVLQRRQPRRPKLDWADRALLAALLGVIPKARRQGLRLLVTPDTIVRWHRDIVRRRWAVRGPGMCLVSAAQVLDHVPSSPAEYCCISLSHLRSGSGWTCRWPPACRSRWPHSSGRTCAASGASQPQRPLRHIRFWRIADVAASHSYPPVRISSGQWESAPSIAIHGQGARQTPNLCAASKATGLAGRDAYWPVLDRRRGSVGTPHCPLMAH
jgi:hypothetical protein